MRTLHVMPPELKQYFDQTLLTTPTPTFRETCQTLLRLYAYIQRRLKKKAMNDPVRQKKYQQKQQEFLELYERAQIKEKEREGQKDHQTQRPFYSIGSIGEKDERLLTRLELQMFRSRTHQFWRRYEISEISQ